LDAYYFVVTSATVLGLALPAPIEKWSLTSLQQRLVKTGGRLIKHARHYWLLLAEGISPGSCLAAYCAGCEVAVANWIGRAPSGADSDDEKERKGISV
jgi:hypothetical protein